MVTQLLRQHQEVPTRLYFEHMRANIAIPEVSLRKQVISFLMLATQSMMYTERLFLQTIFCLHPERDHESHMSYDCYNTPSSFRMSPSGIWPSLFTLVHSVLRASQYELKFVFLFHPIFLYKPELSSAFLVTCFVLVSYLAYHSTLKMEATYFSVTSVDFERIISQKTVLLENVESYICKLLLILLSLYSLYPL
jgi:hypothetical protein